MQIPSNHKKLISDAFYDKSIAFYILTKSKSSEGGRSKGEPEDKGSIQCNAQPITNEQIKQRYGLTTEGDLQLSCKTEDEVKKGYLFDYQGETYEVNRVLRFDTYTKAICQLMD